MNKEMQQKLELFDRNNQALLRKYWFNFSTLPILASSIYTNNGLEVDISKLKEYERIVKKHFGLFSNMRGLMQIPLMANMAAAADPEKYIAEVGEIYDSLKGAIDRTDFDVLCASVLQQYRDSISIPETKEKIKTIMKGMRANHPLLTGKEDMATATMFALSGKDKDALLEEMENCYRILKPHFPLRGEQVQTMSAILAMQDGPAKAKCDKAIELAEAMKAKGLSVNFSAALPIIAGLTLVNKPKEEIVSDIAEIAEWLKGKKGFGWLNLGKEGRISFAMLLYISSFTNGKTVSGTLINSSMASIIMMQIIITIIIAVSIAASVHHSSSSSSSSSD